MGKSTASSSSSQRNHCSPTSQTSPLSSSSLSSSSSPPSPSLPSSPKKTSLKTSPKKPSLKTSPKKPSLKTSTKKPSVKSSLPSSSSPSSNDNLISRSITERIGNNYEGTEKWKGIVKGSNNCYYCIPYNAEQILKIDPSNDKTTLVGKTHNGDWKWYNGFAHENFIYCIPYF